MVTDNVLAIQLPLIFIIGILIADGYWLIRYKTTISRAVWRQSVAHPFKYGIVAAGLICYLILHLWGP